ncbi:DEAD/DEAH box helicase [Leeuwenhoekiella aequorea]|uniref:RNA helicase n=1 Tax=Leeuwenhoekiella aequorea TaxID=283736 RepID=A0A4Q0PCN1_9FLAO|nr:DEAD/DEAH box helicase [Leeuwenhoekiella aequorea]RXG23769.1 ATP-dependent RNA helicase DeaD [Leeuwenhoekiella aequorea]
MNTFKALGLNDAILQAVTDMGFTEPSEVQEKAIPVLLREATDVVALAQTGTGKTAAFGFPLIQKVDATSRKTQGLIISPTRELCLQITNELKSYSKYVKGLNTVAVYGGANIQEQARQISRGAQIIVATPGRMQDMMRRNLVDISGIDFCILDEADEMLNMGFYEDITTILADTPKNKQTWLFSATMPKEVARIAKQFMNDPIEITVGTKNMGAENVSHEYYMVNARDRYQALKRLADANPEIFSVVFCRTKRDTQKVAEQLIEDGYNASALHGDLSQNQRDLVMKSFRARQIQMLVATDVAARGIDVDDITHVINYQLPDEIETYTHRSGRTGRAGKTGISMVIVSKSEVRKVRTLEKIINKKFIQKDIPTGMEICEVQLMHLANDIRNTTINEEINPYLFSINEVLEGLSREELIKKVFSVEFTRFFNYYKKTKDLNAGVVADMKEESGESTRYFINVGQRDGFDWMSLKDFLKDLTGLGEGVYKVDCKDSFSFFNTDTEHKDTILALFEDFNLKGRSVHVEITKDTRSGGGGGGKRKRNDRRSGGSGGGGRRRDDSGGDGGFKKRRSSGGSSSGGGRGRSSENAGGERRGKSKPEGERENKSPFSGKRRRRDR